MRKKSLFYKKIFCYHCQSGMKKKNHRDAVKYLCSNYENYGNCQRIIIREECIVKALVRRYRRELSEDEIREVVIKIIIKSDRLFDIHLTEGVPISYHERGIVF